MHRRTRWEAGIDKARAVAKAQQDGIVADSDSVRVEIVKRIKAGEITLAEGQAELKRIQRDARRCGMKTRSQVWREA